MLDGPKNPGARAIEELQARLIGDVLGVPANTVTIDFVDRVIEERIYPKVRFDRNSEYGGYSNATLKVLTGEEVAKIRREAEQISAQVSEALKPVGLKQD